MSAVDPHTIDVATLAWLTGSAANEHLLRVIRGSKNVNVRTSHGYVFQHLLGAPRTVGELADLLTVTQQAASKMVVELEGLGYVERRADGRDKRVRRVQLTRRGMVIVEKGRAARAVLEAQLVDAVGEAVLDDARKALLALLRLTGGIDAVSNRRVKPPRVT